MLCAVSFSRQMIVKCLFSHWVWDQCDLILFYLEFNVLSIYDERNVWFNYKKETKMNLEISKPIRN